MSTRIAGAPVSWGVIEIPDWGYQMPADRVLKEASSLGLSAVEAGPEGLLPSDPSEVSDLLARYDLKLVGGFVPTVLHEPGVREEQLDLVERRAGFFAAAGADVAVLAASTGAEDYGEVFELDDDDNLILLDEAPDDALRERVEQAVRSCPKLAIKITTP